MLSWATQPEYLAQQAGDQKGAMPWAPSRLRQLHCPSSSLAAALNGHAGVVRELVAAGCDIDAQSQNGSSALHNAASGAAAGGAWAQWYGH